jgi:hypothetical protein
MYQSSRGAKAVSKASAAAQQGAGLSLAAAVWALLTSPRADSAQAGSLEGLEVRESTWDEWEELCATTDASTAGR